MSRCINDFTSITPSTRSINIAGGGKLAIEGSGTVKLRARLPDGSTKEHILTNVLYSRQLNSTRLFSWTYISRKGYKLSATRNTIQVMNQAYEVMLYAVQNSSALFKIQLDQPTANFATYQQFHNAIGYSNIIQAAAARLYQDGESILTKPKDFICT